MHHYECVAPNADIILQSGRFWATSIVLLRTCQNVQNYWKQNCVVFPVFLLSLCLVEQADISFFPSTPKTKSTRLASQTFDLSLNSFHIIARGPAVAENEPIE